MLDIVGSSAPLCSDTGMFFSNVENGCCGMVGMVSTGHR